MPAVRFLGVVAAVFAVALTAPPVRAAEPSNMAARPAAETAKSAAELYAAFDALRTAGKLGTVASATVAADLAVALAAEGHPQADQAFGVAMTLYRQLGDRAGYTRIATIFVRRLIAAGNAPELRKVTEQLAMEATTKGAPREGQLDALDAVLDALAFMADRADVDRSLLPDLKRMTVLHWAPLATEARRFDVVIPLLDDTIAGMRGDPTWSEFVGPFEWQLAQTLVLAGDYRRALAVSLEAEALLRPSAEYAGGWALSAGVAADLLRRFDRFDESLEMYRRTASIMEERGKPDACLLRVGSARVLLDMHRIDEAADVLAAEEACAIALNDPVARGLYLARLAELRIAERRFRAALDTAEDAVTALMDVQTSPVIVLEALAVRARAAFAVADDDRADSYQRALMIYAQDVFPSGHPEFADYLGAYADYHATFFRPEEAADLQRQVVAMLEATFGPASRRTARAIHDLALHRGAAGDNTEAIALLEKVVELLDADPTAGYEQAIARLNLAARFADSGKFEAALTVIHEAEALAAGQPRLDHIVYGLRLVEMQALTGLDRLPEALAAGAAMMRLANPDTSTDRQNMILGEQLFAKTLIKSGDLSAAVPAARNALARTVDLGFGGSGVRRAPAIVLVEAAWAAAQAVPGAAVAARDLTSGVGGTALQSEAKQ